MLERTGFAEEFSGADHCQKKRREGGKKDDPAEAEVLELVGVGPEGPVAGGFDDGELEGVAGVVFEVVPGEPGVMAVGVILVHAVVDAVAVEEGHVTFTRRLGMQAVVEAGAGPEGRGDEMTGDVVVANDPGGEDDQQAEVQPEGLSDDLEPTVGKEPTDEDPQRGDDDPGGTHIGREGDGGSRNECVTYFA